MLFTFSKSFFPILFMILLFSCVESDQSVRTGVEGKILPSFSLLKVDDNTKYNLDNAKGDRPVVLFYISPRCPYCRAQMKDIVNNIQQLSNINFYVLTTYPLSELSSFYHQYKLDKYSNIVAGQDYNKFFRNYFKSSGVPYTAIYGKDGKLMKVYKGKIDIRKIKTVLKT